MWNRLEKDVKPAKFDRCKYPNCEGNIIPGRSKMLCSKHQDMFEFFVWMLENIQVQQAENKSKSGLIIPK